MARRRRGVAWAAATLTLIALALGGYTVAVSQVALPEPTVTLHDTAEASYTHSDADAQTLVDNQFLPTALGYIHTDTVWANTDEALPLASLSKLVTMLVTLEHHPLGVDTSTWGTHIWSTQDWRIQQDVIADLGVAYPLAVGTEIKLVDMFNLIFLPSANDMVSAFAYSVFTDNDAFIAAVDAWADAHALTSLEFVEPTGLSEQNIATPSDVLRIGQLALTHPVISQFISRAETHIEGIGTVENTNPLLGVDEHIVGVKTGRSASAGFNLIVAQESQLDDRTVTKISVTMARPSLEERERSGRTMLAAMDTLPQRVEIAREAEAIGTITDWQGVEYPVQVAAETATTALLPGDLVTRSITVDVSANNGAGGPVGTLTLATPGGDITLPLISTYTHVEPGLWWRILHPGILL